MADSTPTLFGSDEFPSLGQEPATRRCMVCGRLKIAKAFRIDPDSPRRPRCKLYGDLFTMYGITCADFYDMYAAQSGACAICGEAFPSLEQVDIPGGRANGPCVDHRHNSLDASVCEHRLAASSPGPKRSCKDCVRGLLCTPCNTREGKIAHLRRDPLWEATVQYQDDYEQRRLDWLNAAS